MGYRRKPKKKEEFIMKPIWEETDEQRRKDFKSKCAADGKNMKEVLEQIVDEYNKTCKTE